MKTSYEKNYYEMCIRDSAYSFDPNFENSALKERTGVYYEVFDSLSDGADPKEMAQYLIDSVNDVNASNPY